MANGVVLTLASGTHKQILVASGGQQYASLRVLNPNDGVVYAAKNRDINSLALPEWDWKIPSQSYAAVPGPFQTLGLWYIDQSGTGRAGEITVYASLVKTPDPMFMAIGRAVQVTGTSMDIVESVQPANPPLGSDRLWVDTSGNLHILNSSGDSDLFITDETALGGALVGFLPNPTLAANSVSTAQILDGSITGAKIGAQTIVQSNMAKPSIGNPELFAGTAAANIGALGGALLGNLPNPSLNYQGSTLTAVAPLPSSTFTPVLTMTIGAGAWFVWGSIQFITASAAGSVFEARITDGATVKSAGGVSMYAANAHAQMTLAPTYVQAAGPLTLRLDGYHNGVGSSVYHLSPATGQPGATSFFALRLS